MTSKATQALSNGLHQAGATLARAQAASSLLKGKNSVTIPSTLKKNFVVGGEMLV